MRNAENFDTLIAVVLLKMLVKSQIINHSTYKNVLEHYREKEMM